MVATGSLVEVRFDLMIAFLMAAGLVLYRKWRRLWAWSLPGFGGMLKLVPVLLAPLYLISDREGAGAGSARP